MYIYMCVCVYMYICATCRTGTPAHLTRPDLSMASLRNPTMGSPTFSSGMLPTCKKNA